MRKLLFAAAFLLISGALVRPQQSNTHVYELRTYTAAPGKLPDLIARFRDHTVDIFNRHHMHSIGYWVPQDPARSSNTLIYILSHESRAAADQNWKAFRDDPEWQKVSKESEANGKLVEKVESVYMSPTDFSALK